MGANAGGSGGRGDGGTPPDPCIIAAHQRPRPVAINIGWENKAKGFGVGLAAELTTDELTEVLKTVTGRLRPNGIGHSSFPFGHASTAAVSGTLASDNIDSLNISQGSRLALEGLAAALTVGTAYARVEARQHFPSDVLAGAALGHFIGGFADGAFLGVEQRYRILPMVDVSRSGFLVGINGQF